MSMQLKHIIIDEIILQVKDTYLLAFGKDISLRVE